MPCSISSRLLATLCLNVVLAGCCSQPAQDQVNLHELSQEIYEQELLKVVGKDRIREIQSGARSAFEANSETPPVSLALTNEYEEAVFDAALTSEKDDEAAAKGQRAWQGLNFGVGLSFTWDGGSTDRVKRASIVNDVVRVDDEENVIARIMLESHYFFVPDDPWFGLKKGQLGWGPFVAVQPGTEDIIEAFGVGLMVGFRPFDPKGIAGNASFNIAIGAAFDPNVQVLGRGFREDRPPPEGEDSIRFKETDQVGVLAMFSFTWSIF